ncbi:hypothetical protein AB0D78_46960 [Streptomyces avermitilis]|uniref:hypothetical protein n=1 Tax=Streptomyces avermitilis TaxID=33903 RepID=UPI003410D6F5
MPLEVGVTSADDEPGRDVGHGWTLLIIGIVVFLAALINLDMHLWRSGRRHHGVLR